MKKLDASLFSDNIHCISLGKLTREVVDFVVEKHPDYKEILSTEQDVLFWEDRVAHTEKHRNDFLSDIQYLTCFEEIPQTLEKPDYISIHPKDNSISFIKDFRQHVAVAIRISVTGKLSYRTMYPLMDAQLENYIKKNRAWVFGK